MNPILNINEKMCSYMLIISIITSCIASILLIKDIVTSFIIPSIYYIVDFPTEKVNTIKNSILENDRFFVGITILFIMINIIFFLQIFFSLYYFEILQKGVHFISFISDTMSIREAIYFLFYKDGGYIGVLCEILAFTTVYYGMFYKDFDKPTNIIEKIHYILYIFVALILFINVGFILYDNRFLIT